MADFEKFNEGFDYSDGGALYVAEPADGVYDVLSAIWLDGGANGLHYFAFRARFDRGDDLDGYIVRDRYSAADAVNAVTDPYIAEEIGWFKTLDEAAAAVESRAQMGTTY